MQKLFDKQNAFIGKLSSLTVKDLWQKCLVEYVANCNVFWSVWCALFKFNAF